MEPDRIHRNYTLWRRICLIWRYDTTQKEIPLVGTWTYHTTDKLNFNNAHTSVRRYVPISVKKVDENNSFKKFLSVQKILIMCNIKTLCKYIYDIRERAQKTIVGSLFIFYDTEKNSFIDSASYTYANSIAFQQSATR